MELDDLLQSAAEQVEGEPGQQGAQDPAPGGGAAPVVNTTLGEDSGAIIARATAVATESSIVSVEFLAQIGVAAQLGDLPLMQSSSTSTDQVNDSLAKINEVVLTTLREDSRQLLDTVDQLIVPALHEYVGVAENTVMAAASAAPGSPAAAALSAVAAAQGASAMSLADEKILAATKLMDEAYPQDVIDYISGDSDLAPGDEAPVEEPAAGDVDSGLDDKSADTAAPVGAARAAGYDTSPTLSPAAGAASSVTPMTALSSAMPAAVSSLGGGFSAMPAMAGAPVMGGFSPYSAAGAFPSPAVMAGLSTLGGGQTVTSGAGGGLGGSGVSRDELKQMVEDAKKRIESERPTRPSSDSSDGSRKPSPTPPASPTAGSGPSGGDRTASPGTGTGRDLGSSSALRGQTISGGMADKLLAGASGSPQQSLTPTAASGGGGSSAAAGGARGGMPMGMMPMMGGMGAGAGSRGGSGGVGGGTSFDTPEDYNVHEAAERMRGNAVVGGVLRTGTDGDSGDGWVEPTRRAEPAADSERRPGLFG